MGQWDDGIDRLLIGIITLLIFILVAIVLVTVALNLIVIPIILGGALVCYVTGYIVIRLSRHF